MGVIQAEIDFSKARFDGPDYVPELDQERLSGQIKAIYHLMKDEQWRTLGEIETTLQYPQASISANLRHFRKARFGSNEVNKRRCGTGKEGLFEYQLKLSVTT